MSTMSFRESIWILIIFLLIQVSFRMAYTIAQKGVLHTLIGTDVLRLVREVSILLIFLYILKLMGYISFGNWSIDLKSFTFFLTILLILLTVENVLLVNFTNPEQLLIDAIHQYPLSQIISIILLSPIIEELIFRKVMIGILFSNNIIIGILVSSLIFALVHLQFNAIDFLLIVTYGVILGFLMLLLIMF